MYLISISNFFSNTFCFVMLIKFKYFCVAVKKLKPYKKWLLYQIISYQFNVFRTILVFSNLHSIQSI